MSIANAFYGVKRFFIRLKSKIVLRRYKVNFVGKPEIKGKIVIVSRGKIDIGENVIINSSAKRNPVDGCCTCLYCRKGAVISIGNGTRISNSRIIARNSITIGQNVYLGAGCRIYDSDFHPIDYEKRIANDQSAVKNSPVVIEDGSFIGAGAIILKGVTIGKRAVVGAGSVVTKDVPDDMIFAGNPAKEIGRGGQYGEKQY